jgi:hypothetical protein
MSCVAVVVVVLLLLLVLRWWFREWWFAVVFSVTGPDGAAVLRAALPLGCDAASPRARRAVDVRQLLWMFW